MRLYEPVSIRARGTFLISSETGRMLIYNSMAKNNRGKFI